MAQSVQKAQSDPLLLNTGFNESANTSASLNKSILERMCKYETRFDAVIDEAKASSDVIVLETSLHTAVELIECIQVEFMKCRETIAVEDVLDLETDLNLRHIQVNSLEKKVELIKKKDAQKLEFEKLKLMGPHAANLVIPNPTGVKTVSIKLPTVSLPTFNGKIHEFQGFIDRFNSAIDSNTSLADVDKLQYLLGCLTGDPLTLVRSLKLEAKNYIVAKDLLTKQYGSNTVAIQSLKSEISKVKPIFRFDVGSLRSQVSIMTAYIQSLAQLGVDLDSIPSMFLNDVIDKFPFELGVMYYRAHSEKERKIKHFLEFVTNEVKVRESLRYSRVDSNKMPHFNKQDNYSKNDSKTGIRSTVVNSAKANESGQVISSLACQFGDGNHGIFQCPLSTKEKLDIVKKNKWCFNCLKKGHGVASCISENRCKTCNKKHHSVIHYFKVEDPKASAEAIVSPLQIKAVHLMVFSCLIRAGDSWRKVRGFLDGGSQCSFVKESLAKTLNIKPKGKVRLSVRGFESENVQTRNIYDIVLKGQNTEIFQEFELLGTSVLPEIDPIQDQSLLTKIDALGVHLSDQDSYSNEIDILIGQDYLWSVVKSSVLDITPKLKLTETTFGWVCGGCNDNATSRIANPIIGHVQIEDLWRLESIGIKDGDEDSFVSNQFKETVKRLPSGRYEVQLPFNSHLSQLKSNYDRALNQLFSGVKKMAVNKDLQSKYVEAIRAYVTADHAEVVKTIKTENKTYYIPHHPVIKENRLTTKCRIVFNASCPQNGLSLNSCLYTGPSLNPNILKVWLRFRFWLEVLLSDVSKAFLQISVYSPHRDVLRFLWVREELFSQPITWANFLRCLQVMRMKVVSFGVNCSPFLLCAVIRHHAVQFQNEFPNEAIDLHDIYMDDLASGENGVEETIQKALNFRHILDSACLPLEKWESSSPKVRQKLRELNFSMRNDDNVEIAPVKVLGVNWHPETDEIFHEGNLNLDLEKLVSKRVVLKVYGQIFDPLGLWSPLTIQLKMLIQDLCKQKLNWDEAIDPDAMKSLEKWLKDFKQISQIRVPRWIGWKRGLKWSLEVCCDASPRAYGCTLHFKSTENERLIFSKARLAPIKQLTVPKLELMAAVLGARCAQYLIDSIYEEMRPEKITFWTDSQITLAWITQQENSWKPFVSNRVREILSLTSVEQWFYIKTECNPADLLTRPAKLKTLVENENWWRGRNTDVSLETPNFANFHVEEELLSLPIVEIPDDLNLFGRFSSYQKLLRVVARIFRWKNKFRGPLAVDELIYAEKKLIELIQKTEFRPELSKLGRSEEIEKNSKIIKFDPILKDGLICVGGRLAESTLPERQKHPILLPSLHPFVHLLIDDMHEKLFHGGTSEVLFQLRERFWILRGRRTVQNRLKHCLVCRKGRIKPPDPIEAQLPSFRVCPAAPFKNAGIDHFGPFYIKGNIGKKLEKAYGLIVTCLVTRAVHVEACQDLTVDEFILAFRRFCARYGNPELVLSDNSKTFKSSANIFRRFSSLVFHDTTHGFLMQNRIRWKFITPLSPWHGGCWERMIRIVKDKLRKALGKSLLTYEELQTIFLEISAIINSRPLCTIFEEAGKDFPLTPNSFLNGGMPNLMIRERDIKATHLKKLFKDRKNFINYFWGEWLKAYLQQLRNFNQRKKGDALDQIKVDEIVLIERIKVNPFCWPLARVIEVFPDNEGIVRTVKVRLGDRTELVRPVQHLRRLESE